MWYLAVYDPGHKEVMFYTGKAWISTRSRGKLYDDRNEAWDDWLKTGRYGGLTSKDLQYRCLTIWETANREALKHKLLLCHVRNDYHE